MLAAIVDEGKALKFWNSQTGRLLRRMPLKGDMSSCDFSPDLKLIACGPGLWNTATGLPLKTLTGIKGASLAFSNDSKFLATTGELVSWSAQNNVKVWDVQTGKLKSELKGHTNEVSSAAFSLDGQILLTGSRDGTVRFWDTNTGALKGVLLIEDPPRLGP
jgi:WD40 repeat protein